MLNNGNSNSGDKKTPATPTQTPISTGSVESVVNCKASGNLWSIEQSVAVDEDEQKVTKLSYKLKADSSNLITTNSETDEVDGEVVGVNLVKEMADAMKTHKSVAGVTIKDVSDDAKIDFTYDAVREDIEDEDVLENLFDGSDGLTASEIKSQIEANTNGESGIKLTCEIE